MSRLSNHAKHLRTTLIDRVLDYLSTSPEVTPKALLEWYRVHLARPWKNQSSDRTLDILKVSSAVCVERILANCVMDGFDLAKITDALRLAKLEVKDV